MPGRALVVRFSMSKVELNKCERKTSDLVSIIKYLASRHFRRLYSNYKGILRNRIDYVECSSDTSLLEIVCTTCRAIDSLGTESLSTLSITYESLVEEYYHSFDPTFFYPHRLECHSPCSAADIQESL